MTLYFEQRKTYDPRYFGDERLICQNHTSPTKNYTIDSSPPLDIPFRRVLEGWFIPLTMASRPDMKVSWVAFETASIADCGIGRR